jgi:hypothetical protein
VWCAGEYLLRVECGFDGLNEIAGVPIVRRPGETSGEIQLLCTVDVPEGGWAEPEILSAFARTAMDLSVRSVRAGVQAPRPLNDKVVAQSSAPVLLARILSSSRMADLSPTQTWIRDASRQRELNLPFSGRRWISEDHLYETQISSNELELNIFRWHVSSFPDDINPITGMTK